MLNWILQTWITIAVLMIGLEWLQRKRRISPVLAHSLWCVLLLKSVAPPVLVWPVAIPVNQVTASIAFSEAQAEASRSLPVEPQNTAVFSVEPQRVGDAPPSEPVNVANARLTSDETVKDMRFIEPPSPIVGVQPSGAGAPASSGDTFLKGFAILAWTPSALIGLWLAGSLITLLVEVFRIIKIDRIVRRGTINREIDGEIQSISQSMGLRSIKHLVVDGIQTPFVWSVGRTILVWPASLCGVLSSDARRALIAHELAHIKRHDHWAAWLELLSNVLWWWNPIQWRLRNNMRDAAEQACDAYAIQHSQILPRTYAETLLTICQAQMHSNTCSSVLAATHSDRRALEDRMRRLFDKPRSIQQTKIGVFVTLFTALIALPVWSQQQPASKKEPTEKAQVANTATNITPASHDETESDLKPPKPTFVDSGVRPEELPPDWVFPKLIVPSPKYPSTPASVKGKVVESDAKSTPVEGAVVALMKGSYALAVTRSDSAGNFEFKKLPVFGMDVLKLVAIHSKKGLGLVNLFNLPQAPAERSEQKQTDIDLGIHVIPLHEFRESEGTVLDSDRRPLKDASVSLCLEPLGHTYSPFADLDTLQAKLRTDQDGKFKFVAAPRVYVIEVVIAHPDWPTTTWQLPPDLSNKYQMPKGVRVAGKVHFPEAAQNPVASIEVANKYLVRTQADGTFSVLINENPVDRKARVTCYAFCDNLLLLPPEPKMLQIKPSGHELEFKVEAGRMVSGVVTSQEGKPVANMYVAWNAINDNQLPRFPANPDRFAAATNDEGRFTLEIPNTAGELSAYRIKLLAGEKYVDNYGEEHALLDSVTTIRESFQHIPALDTNQNVDFKVAQIHLTVPNLSPLQFKVRDEDNAPVEVGRLRFLVPAETKSPTELQAIPQVIDSVIENGQAQTVNPRVHGHLDGLAESSDGSLCWFNFAAQTDEAAIKLQVQKPKAWLTGRAIVDGQPLAGVTVKLYPEIERGEAPTLLSNFYLSAITNELGEYKLPMVIPMQSHVIAEIPPGLLRLGLSQKVRSSLQSSQLNDIQFYRPAGKISGRVVDLNGEPVVGLHIVVHNNRRNVSPNLFWADNIANPQVRIDGDNNFQPNLVFSYAGNLPEFRSAVPQRREELILWTSISRPTACSAVTDAKGNFEISNVPGGDLYLSLSSLDCDIQGPSPVRAGDSNIALRATKRGWIIESTYLPIIE